MYAVKTTTVNATIITLVTTNSDGNGTTSVEKAEVTLSSPTYTSGTGTHLAQEAAMTTHFPRDDIGVRNQTTDDTLSVSSSDHISSTKSEKYALALPVAIPVVLFSLLLLGICICILCRKKRRRGQSIVRIQNNKDVVLRSKHPKPVYSRKEVAVHGVPRYPKMTNLLEKWKTLAVDIDLAALQNALTMLGALTMKDCGILQASHSVEEKCSAFSKILSQKDEEIYWKLLSSLRDIGQTCVRSQLEPPGLIQVRIEHNNIKRITKVKIEVSQCNPVFLYNMFYRAQNDTSLMSRFLSEVACLGVTVEAIYCGSVVLVLRCRTAEHLDKLWDIYCNGRLQMLLDKDHKAWNDMEGVDARGCHVGVVISEDEYKQCKAELSHMESIAFPNWQGALKQSKDDIIKFMSSDMVIEKLWSASIVSTTERTAVLSGKSEEERNSRLLHMLIEKDDWAFVKFTEALDTTGQEHVVSLIAPKRETKLRRFGSVRGNIQDHGGSSKLLTRKHRSSLREQHMELVSRMQPDDVLICLEAEGVLGPFHYERVKSRPDRYSKCVTLLHILHTGTDDCFMSLVRSLCKSNQCELAKLLDEKGHGEIHEKCRNNPMQLWSAALEELSME